MNRFKISVSSLATQDVQHILLWYQEIEPTLATKFLSELRKFYERIAINPELYGFFNVNQQIRKIRFKKFPYFFYIVLRIRQLELPASFISPIQMNLLKTATSKNLIIFFSNQH